MVLYTNCESIFHLSALAACRVQGCDAKLAAITPVSVWGERHEIYEYEHPCIVLFQSDIEFLLPCLSRPRHSLAATFRGIVSDGIHTSGRVKVRAMRISWIDLNEIGSTVNVKKTMSQAHRSLIF